MQSENLKITQTYVSTLEKYQAAIEDENKCPLCGTHLQFLHKVDHLIQSIEEQAHCPCCHIQTKARACTLN